MLLGCLLIFAKYPEPGRVKTRLAKKTGPERAALLYKEMVGTVVQKTAPQGDEYRQVLCFDPPERRDDFQRWFPDLDLRPQVPENLGERMSTAIRGSLESGATKVAVIGSDCPDLDRDLIIQAFQKLEQSDLVIGPASDGGYYLIGIRRGVLQYAPTLFNEIPWSTDRVLSMTLERAKAAGLRVELLTTLSDIDEIP